MSQETVTKMSNQEMTAAILELQAQVKALQEAQKPARTDATREMTDEDANRIMTGDLAQTKHKEAASTLGLSYGQVYSCRLGYTFKNVHKKMREDGIANPWIK